MPDAALLAVKALNGGLFVAAFAIAAELLVPKRFAGLFSTSPAVALANLSIVVINKGRNEAAVDAQGMVAGAIGVTVASLVGILVIRRLGAIRGSFVVWCVWGLVASTAYVGFVR